MHNALVSGLAIGALLVSTCGCAALGLTSSEKENSAPCEALTASPEPEQEPEPAPRQVVLLVDRTNSTRSTPAAAPDSAPDYPAVLATSIDQLTKSPDEITVGGFDGSSATLVWTRTRLSVRTVHENERNQEEHREKVAACLVESVRTAAETPPSTPDTDILGNLTEAAKHEPALIVMATDGLTQGGCVGLRGSAIGDDAAIEAIRKRCEKSGELPDLKGVRLVMFGIGHSGPTQPGPKSSQAQWLERLWLGLCEDTGASCWVKTITDIPAEVLETSR